MNPATFNEFCKQVDPQWRVEALESGGIVKFWNRTEGQFTVQLKELMAALHRWHDRNEDIRDFISRHSDFDPVKGPWIYKEKVFRDVFEKFFPKAEFGSVATVSESQTRGLMLTMSKLVGATIGNRACGPTDPLLLDPTSLESFLQKEGLAQPTEKFTCLQLAQFVEAAKSCGFVSGEQLEARFIKSLVTKPFVILTGNSGTGKTKLGQLLAHWLTGHSEEAKCGYAVVPVGADWTDNRNVVGFVNHLRPNPQQNGRPTFNSTPILDLVLRANADDSRPYFLILDEMNLSHVERYFADLLSAMESDKGILLHSEAEPLQTGAGIPVCPTIAFPDNLFVIGTVNVDETTYMFSPKVLDRANVIEFRVTATDVEGFLETGGKAMRSIQMAPIGYAEGFLDLARRAKDPVKLGLKLASSEAELPEGVFEKLKQCREVLGDLFAILQGCRQEFAYRTIKDILTYAHVDYEFTESGLEWDQARCLDVQVLQKILPKLHGTKKRISPVLVALAKYCEELNVEEALKLVLEEVNPEFYKALKPDRYKTPVLKASYTKLCEMILAVRRDQFVSFIQ